MHTYCAYFVGKIQVSFMLHAVIHNLFILEGRGYGELFTTKVES